MFINNRYRILLVTVGFFFLLLFFVFSKFVRAGGMEHIDFSTTVKLQGKFPDTLFHWTFDNIMTIAGEPASAEISSMIAITFSAIAMFDWKKKKIRWQGIVVPLGFALFILIELYGKNVLEHPGPPFFMLRKPSFQFPQFYINEKYSYPSGHAGRSLYIALMMVFVFRDSLLANIRSKKTIVIVACMLGWAFFVGFSRILLGHHWLSDIVGGYLTAAGLVFLLTGLVI
jgi:membrane-associated phospholipid phosphatase